VYVRAHIDWTLKGTTGTQWKPKNYFFSTNVSSSLGGSAAGGTDLASRGKKATVVYGYVLDNATGLPVSGVGLTITVGTCSGAVTQATTDASGFYYFDISGCGSGSYSVKVVDVSSAMVWFPGDPAPTPVGFVLPSAMSTGSVSNNQSSRVADRRLIRSP
jgi:hypothetical protein